MSFLNPNQWEISYLSTFPSWYVSWPPFVITGVDPEFWRQLMYVMIHRCSSKTKQDPHPSLICLYSRQVTLFQPLKIWVLHLCGTNSISSSNKPNEYICGTLQCIHRHQRGKYLTSAIVFFQSWISCCLDHFSLCFYSNAASRLVKANWLKLLGELFICFSLMFNAMRHNGGGKNTQVWHM